MGSIFYKVLAVCIITSLGYILQKKGKISQALLSDGSWLVIHIFTPSFIIYSFISNFAFSHFVTYIKLPAVALLTMSASYIVAAFCARVFKFEKDTKKSFVFLNLVINYSFLPITIIFLTHGNAGLTLLFIHNIGCSIMHWTLGVHTLAEKSISSKTALLKIFFTPGTIAIAIGIAGSFFRAHIPEFVTSTLSIVGQATIPIALIVAGGVIANVPMHIKKDLRELGLLVFTRMLVLPAIGIGIINLFDLPELARQVALTVAIMPSASTAPIFVQIYGGNTSFATKGFVITTLCSLVTIPCFYYFFA